MSEPCGHTTSGNGFTYTCDLAAGHKGLHREKVMLRDGPSVTNWGSDGLAPWATKDRFSKVLGGREP